MDYLFIADVKTAKTGKSEQDKAWDRLKIKIDKERKLKALGVIK